MPQKKEELMTTKTFATNYRKYYTKLKKMITSYSQDTRTQEQEMLKSIVL